MILGSAPGFLVFRNVPGSTGVPKFCVSVFLSGNTTTRFILGLLFFS